MNNGVSTKEGDKVGEELRCPACGGANECGLEKGEKSCWCFEVVVSEERRAEIAKRFQPGRCLCRTCLMKEQ